MAQRTVRDEFSQQQRRALLEVLSRPRSRTPEELAEYVCEQLDRGRSERAIAAELRWDVDTVRRAAAERVTG